MIRVPVKMEIVPTKLIFKGEVRPITDIVDKFVFHGFTLHFTDSDLLKRVVINGVHPNCHPTSGELCLPKDLKFKKSDETIIPTVANLLQTFNLDDSYFQPWHEFTYE